MHFYENQSWNTNNTSPSCTQVFKRKVRLEAKFQNTCEACNKTYNTGARMLPNIGGPSMGRCTDNKTNERKILATYRKGALWTCSYQTISDEAVYVIAGITLIDILARERQRPAATHTKWDYHWLTEEMEQDRKKLLDPHNYIGYS